MPLRPPTLLLALCLTAAACSDNTPPEEGIVVGPGGCASTSDCAANEICLHHRCEPRDGQTGNGPTGQLASLQAAHQTLDFGGLPSGVRSTLELALSNDGAAVVTIDQARVADGPSADRFSIEPMGSGPFWIRPGRSRSIFVTYEADGGGPHTAELQIASGAPTVTVELKGQ